MAPKKKPTLRTSAPPASSARPSHPVSLEEMINEVRSDHARRTAELEAKLAQLEGMKVANATQYEPRERRVRDAGEDVRKDILRALDRANKGKPGPMWVADLVELLDETKNSIHHHAMVLDSRGLVTVIETHNPRNGRKSKIVYPRALAPIGHLPE